MYLNVKSLLIELLIISAICSAILVIISKNPVISVIFLISLVLNSALFLMVKGMHFLGISYILIYLGAIIVLFLFVIMMINIKLTDILETGYQYTKNIPLALTVSGLFLYEFFNVLPSFLNSPAGLAWAATQGDVNWPIDNSTILSLIKEIVLTLNSLFNNGSGLEATLRQNPAEGWFLLSQEQMEGAYGHPTSAVTALATQTNKNLPETLISSTRSAQQIISVAYSLYTYGSFLFLYLGIILLLAMIAPIYLSRR